LNFDVDLLTRFDGQCQGLAACGSPRIAERVRAGRDGIAQVFAGRDFPQLACQPPNRMKGGDFLWQCRVGGTEEPDRRGLPGGYDLGNRG
jgi:hypothetical protein